MTAPPIHAEIILGKVALRNTRQIHNDILSEIPGNHFKGRGADYWEFPLTWVTLVCLTRSFPDITLSDPLRAWAENYWAWLEPIVKLRTGQGEEYVTDELLEQFAAIMPASRSPLTPVKRRYQVSGALLLATAKRFVLLDELGMGKMTEAGTALSLYPDTRPALIVAPASTLYSWQKELAVFGLDSTILDGDASRRRKVFASFDGDDGIMICSYGILPKHSRVQGYGNITLSDEHRTPKELNEIGWATTCADEVHRAKSAKAVQTRALWAVSDRSEYRWGLTGTPIEGSPMDFWTILHYIDPVSWPSSVRFRDRWVDHSPSIWGGFEIHGMREDRLDEWEAVSQSFWRKKSAEGLPPVAEEVRYCELKGRHLKAYKDMEKQLMAEVGEENVVLFAQNHMVKAGRLKQMAQSFIEADYTDTGEFDDEGEPIIDTIVTPIEPSPKLDLLFDTLQDYEGTPCLIWFDSVKFMRLAQARFDKANTEYMVIDGSMDAKDRNHAVECFQAGKVDILLLSISAASEGITLTRAPLSIDVERSWSLIKEDQKARRNLRIGSEIHDEIRRVVLITKDTIEEDQHEELAKKRDQRDQVVSPFAAS
jgi:SNF2 family DNA or RNA helicase